MPVASLKVMSFDFSLTLSLFVKVLMLFWNFEQKLKGNKITIVAGTPVTIMETKAEECSKIEEQPKMVFAPKGSPRKEKRMANVLEAVLRPTKMAPSTTPKISEDIHEPKMAINVDITPGLDVADPS